MSGNGNEWVTRFVPLRAAKVDLADERRLEGYAIVFNTLSQDLGGFKERIAPSAVDRTLKSGTNVDALLDHRRETMTIIGSTDSGLLQLRKDRYGLKVLITPPDTTNARDVLTVVRAGLVKGMSFAFRVWPDGQEWDEENGLLVRTVTDMEFSEVSIVVNPAYLLTTIAARNAQIDAETLAAFRQSLKWQPSVAFRERMLRASAR
jgi:HK97 family phage prohead protease